jgi:hypothetical protein
LNTVRWTATCPLSPNLHGRVAPVVGPLPIPAELLEHPDQGPLSQLPGASGRHLEAAPRAGDQAGPFQGSFDLLQATDVPGCVGAEGPAEGVLVDVVQRRARVIAPERSLQLLEVMEPLQAVERGPERHGLFPPARCRLVPRKLGEQGVQV